MGTTLRKHLKPGTVFKYLVKGVDRPFQNDHYVAGYRGQRHPLMPGVYATFGQSGGDGVFPDGEVEILWAPPGDQGSILTTDKAARKATPIATGVVDYFPRALAEIARVSKAGNDQHNPGQPLHWDKSKSTDHADCIARHLIERGTIDDDGMRHSAKLAWRALALLETELEKEAGK